MTTVHKIEKDPNEPTHFAFVEQAEGVTFVDAVSKRDLLQKLEAMNVAENAKITVVAGKKLGIRRVFTLE